MLGDPGPTRAHLDAALLVLDQSDAARRAWVGLGELWLDSVHDVPHSGDDYLSLLARIPREPPDRRRKEACDRVALRLSLVGRYDEAVSCATEAVALGTALGDPDDVDRLRSTLAVILALAGAHARALELVDELRRRLSDRTDLGTASDILGGASMVAWLAGDTEGALRDARSVAHLLGGDRPGPMPAEWAARDVEPGRDPHGGRPLGRGGSLPRAGGGRRPDHPQGQRVGRAAVCPPRRLARDTGRRRVPGLLGGPHLRRVAPAPGPAGRAASPVLADRRVRLRRRLPPGARPRPVRARAGAMGLAPPAYLLPVLATVAREEADRALLQDPDACTLRSPVASTAARDRPPAPPGIRFASLVRAELLRGHRTEAWSEAVARWRPTGMPHWLARALLGQGRSAVERVTAQRRPPRTPATARELEVLRLMTEGATNGASATALHLREDGQRACHAHPREARGRQPDGRGGRGPPSWRDPAADVPCVRRRGGSEPVGVHAGRPAGQPTLTPAQAASTASYCVLPAPYRSLAAFSDAVRAPW